MSTKHQRDEKGTDAAAKAEPREPADSTSVQDPIGALAFVLRKIAEYPLELDHLGVEGARDLALKWKAHVEALRDGSRDPQWGRFMAFFSSFREGEQSFHRRKLRDLRESATLLVKALRDTIRAEGAADRKVSGALDRLKDAIDDGSHERLRAQARETVSTVTTFLEDMRVRHGTQATEIRRLRAAITGAAEGEPRVEAKRDEIAGREGLDRRVAQSVELGRLSAQPTALILVEIDNFGAFVERHGAGAGQRLMREAARLCQRYFDRAGDLVALLEGGLLAIVADVSGDTFGYERTQELLRAIRGIPAQVEIGEAQLTASIGLAEHKRAESADAWLARASTALTKARFTGRDRLVMLPAA